MSNPYPSASEIYAEMRSQMSKSTADAVLRAYSDTVLLREFLIILRKVLRDAVVGQVRLCSAIRDGEAVRAIERRGEARARGETCNT
jgi:hypothetical protein